MSQPQTGEGARTLGARGEQFRHQASVFEDIAVAHKEIYALYQIAQTMGTSLGVSDTMGLVSSKLIDLVPFSACALFLYSDATDSLQCRFATGTDSELIQQLALRGGQGLTGWVARNRRPLVNAPAERRHGSDGLEGPDRARVSARLPADLRRAARSARWPSTTRSRASTATITAGCSTASASRRRPSFTTAIVFEQTQEDSLTDPLTGLPNTRSMFQHLTRELARADRLKSEVSLLVMDLNDFKDINDNYGHHIGDRALREVAKVLRATIRPYDICVRYAGDEFIVVLSGCGREEAENKRAELQDAVDGLVFEPRAEVQSRLSISAGVAVFPHDGDSYESLLAKADSRMYHGQEHPQGRPCAAASAG